MTRAGLRHIALGLLAAALACSDPTPVAPSGFLEHFDELQPGRGDQARLVYIDTAADFSAYEKIWVEPVVAWSDGAPPAPLETLAAHFDGELRRELAREFELVEGAGPGTLRLRAAVTAMSETGASAELEILDAETGRRLVAVADARGAEGASEGEASTPEQVIAFWAERARVRLAAFRSFDLTEKAHEASAAPDTP